VEQLTKVSSDNPNFDSFAVDVLACYNRTPEADVQILPSNFAASNGGGVFTFPNAVCLDHLSQTKYVFVTWGEKATKVVRCSVPAAASVDDSELSRPIGREISVSVTYTTRTFELDIVDGTWCKIVFLDKNDVSTLQQPKIFVTGNIPDLNSGTVLNRQIYIPNGVLYHKRLSNVSIKE
jgi:hypothetical protein